MAKHVDEEYIKGFTDGVEMARSLIQQGYDMGKPDTAGVSDLRVALASAMPVLVEYMRGVLGMNKEKGVAPQPSESSETEDAP